MSNFNNIVGCNYMIELMCFFVFGDDRVIIYMGVADDTRDAANA